MSLRDKVRLHLEELGASPKRSLGQNFLVGERVIDEILDRVRRLAPTEIIEIGPGLGALTEGLISMGAPLRLVELDQKFAQMWRERGVDVTEIDALKLDWKDFVRVPTLLASNLPYQIAASLVVELCTGPECVQSMVLMFQKEVAQRIQARPSTPDYGFLSVAAQVFWRVEKVIDASPQEFYPAPNVASRVLAFRRVGAPMEDPASFLRFVKSAFSQRRKLLQKNLSSYGWNNWDEIARVVGFNPKARAEELSPDQFVKLYRAHLSSKGERVVD